MMCNDPDIFCLLRPLKQPWKKHCHPVVVQKKRTRWPVGALMVHKCIARGKHAGKVSPLERASNPPHTIATVFWRAALVPAQTSRTWSRVYMDWMHLWWMCPERECHTSWGRPYFFFACPASFLTRHRDVRPTKKKDAFVRPYILNHPESQVRRLIMAKIVRHGLGRKNRSQRAGGWPGRQETVVTKGGPRCDDIFISKCCARSANADGWYGKYASSVSTLGRDARNEIIFS